MNTLTSEIKLTIDQVKQWCADNGYVIHSAYKMTSGDLLTVETIKAIAAQINGVDVERLSTKDRDTYVVWARWLVFYYFNKTSKLSLAKIGRMCNRDHSTVINAIAGVSNPYLDGWRKSHKERFEFEANNAHKAIGIEPVFSGTIADNDEMLVANMND